MHVFTREIETRRFKSAPGMPVPARFDTVYGRKYLKEHYGEDVIAELDYRHPENFVALLGDLTDGEVRQKYGQLKTLADAQAKQIRDLEKDNEQLKKQVARLKPPS